MRGRNLTRWQSRQISRSRLMTEAISPCVSYSNSSGTNPFDYLFSKTLPDHAETPEQKKMAHKLKMQSEQKSAKARAQRKRNKV